MRIVYFAHSVLNRGGDKMVLAHLRHLAEAGHRVTIRCNVLATDFPLHTAFRFEKPLFPTKLGTLVSALLERQRCDLVLATIVPTALLLRLANRRVVYFAQDDNETAYRFPASFLIRGLYFVTLKLLRLPAIAVSRALAQSFAGRFDAHCRIVENGVDTSVFFPAPSMELIAEKRGRKSILVYARSDWRKGFDLAKEVVARVAAESSEPFEVWTVGEQLPWSDAPVRCRAFGALGESSLREILSSADLFLYPSRSEGFPLMVLEAFACGCPVVTTEAVTYVRNGEDALVSPVGDVQSLAAHVGRLLADTEFAGRLSAAGLLLAGCHAQNRSSALFQTELLRVVNNEDVGINA